MYFPKRTKTFPELWKLHCSNRVVLGANVNAVLIAGLIRKTPTRGRGKEHGRWD